MKAEELMVWDWAFSPEMKQPITIKAILEHNQVIFAQRITNDISNRYLRNCSEIEPIPITPEILEKNGFVKDKEEKTLGTTYHILIPTGYEANSYTIQITLYKEPICGVSVLLKIWGRIPPYDGGINDIHLCGAKYVHELQHALRLCGIDKEIVL